MNQKLKQKVAIVTGSSFGIGKAIAERLAEEGARVVINSANSVAEGTKIAAALPQAIYVQADLGKSNDRQNLIQQTLDQYGRLDMLINNAALSAQLIRHDDLETITDEVFQKIFVMNVQGTWSLSCAALPHLQASGDGAIINITSIAGMRAMGASIPYGMSKAAINQMTIMLAQTFAPTVRVNAIAPGVIQTRRTEELGLAALMEICSQDTALKRPGQPSEIAETVIGVLLSTYMTGQIIACDGGYLL